MRSRLGRESEVHFIHIRSAGARQRIVMQKDRGGRPQFRKPRHHRGVAALECVELLRCPQEGRDESGQGTRSEESILGDLTLTIIECTRREESIVEEVPRYRLRRFRSGIEVKIPLQCSISTPGCHEVPVW